MTSRNDEDETGFELQSGLAQRSHIAASEEHSDEPVLHPTPQQATFSPFVAFCFTLNFILGTGFLTIPWAFIQSGLVLSVLLLIVSAIISDMAKDYLLETMARAEVMLDHDMQFIPWKEEGADGTSEESKRSSGDDHAEEEHFMDEDEDVKEKIPRRTTDGSKENDGLMNDRDRALSSTSYVVRDRKFEVNTLCRVFLGNNGVTAFTFFISLYLVGILWAYTSVFSSAMADALPVFSHDFSLNYTLYAILFGSIVVPLSCLELDEQVPVQVFMTGCRFLMLFLMIGTTNACADNAAAFAVANNETTSFSDRYHVPMFRLQGLYKTLPIIIVANMYHPAIPGLAAPVAKKEALGTIFRSTSIFTSVAYSIIGVVLGTAFGLEIEESSNLNWKGFGSKFGNKEAKWWEEAISFYVMLFPALDVLSAFPLNAITLGNNIFGGYYGNRVHEMEHNRCAIVSFRLLASVPPVVGGLFVRELGEISDYAGCTGFVIGFTFPALLFMRSRMLAIDSHYPAATYYASYASWGQLPKIILWFGIAMVIFILSSLILF